jgi:hypothetical protein
MVPGLLDGVRAACAEVSARAQHVRIDESRIPSYAASLPLDQARAAQLDAHHHYLGQPEDTLAYFLTLDAINFGSGYFPELRKRQNLSGYLTVAASLTDRFRTRGPFSAEELSSLTTEDCAGLFGQMPARRPVGELMGLFASALNQLGSYLLERFNGRFVRLVEAAGTQTERLVQLLSQMPYFADVQRYGELEVPFYKRAQLSAADLSIALDGRGYGFFGDLDRLTIFADNLVPHVLRVDGVLRYEESLARRIEAGELIPAGSAEEVEIRAAALYAAELLVQALRRAGQSVSARELDYLLWNRGQQPFYKALPRHRTRTVFY